MNYIFYSGYPSNSQNKIKESRVPILKKKPKESRLCLYSRRSAFIGFRCVLGNLLQRFL